jgi:hypothetical protein
MRPAFKDVAVPPVPSATLARAVRPRVAIGIPMTSRKLRLTAVESSPLMKIAVPSIVKSLPGDRAKFHVVIYAGYDEGDAFWSKVSGGGGGECGGGGDGNGVCVCVCVCVRVLSRPRATRRCVLGDSRTSILHAPSTSLSRAVLSHSTRRARSVLRTAWTWCLSSARARQWSATRTV